MLFTDDFVFIHQPKIGGTFVREALREVGQREARMIPRGILQRLGLLHPRYACVEAGDYHGTCREIPASQRGKRILSVVRNPFDYYVSFYHFGWWATHPEDSYRDFDAVKREFPGFPELSFDAFLALANRYFNEFEMIGSSLDDASHRHGYYTTQFILYYFKDPRGVYREIDDDYIREKRWTRDMFDVRFMRTHSLNRDLHRELTLLGYPASLIDPVTTKLAVRPDEQREERPSREHAHYYTDATRAFVLEKEKLLFAMFPDLLS